MLNNLGLGFVFTARDLASAKMSALEKRFSSLDDRVTGGTDRMTGAFRQLGIGIGIFTAGAATVAGAFALADAAGKFEQSSAQHAIVLSPAPDFADLDGDRSATGSWMRVDDLLDAGDVTGMHFATMVPEDRLHASSSKAARGRKKGVRAIF
jgi:hypothetical protein